ncbi:MAG: prepilin-type cleavage/methylation domain-containing protein [Betaproteobacteria bacterium]|nr:prepilin-type cleavage/methylation domain-containing protein [Betaproteobacteria bacterium]
MRRGRGATVSPRSELLITVAAVAVLATIAYPSYLSYKVRANRAAAQAFLIDLANRQQLHFLDARGYADTLARLGAASIPPEVAAYYAVPDPVVDNAAAPPTFVVSAAAKTGTMQARDGDLSLNSAGVRAGHW